MENLLDELILWERVEDHQWFKQVNSLILLSCVRSSNVWIWFEIVDRFSYSMINKKMMSLFSLKSMNESFY